ncbi:3'-5' exonuclease [Agrilactobacillus yilanensis]|uniref:3'-5' exonuclease n=1 Tax=Agrilactobacillus yilanensis TaxID=2485997 RepID=A0ABW4JAV3_9LACO|nr:3'-5' exonuclease [Agrilactobacillus yilanensis]
MNFTAMDFETANSTTGSACSIALVVVRDDQITDSFYTLINPETYFSKRNIQVHGITAKAVAQAPTFDLVWPHIAPLFDPQHLVAAHNASFDIRTLKGALANYKLPEPHFLTLDTLRTSRKFYPEFPNHKLNTVAKALQIDLKHHHNALDDSIACAKILCHQVQQFGPDRLKTLVKLV